MKVSIIGSNGLLSSEFGIYFNVNNISIDTYGLGIPRNHRSKKFFKVDLIKDKIDFEELSKSDLIIYASGAGIQSNLEESYNDIYMLNTFIPISISKELSLRSFNGTFVTFGSYFEVGNNSNDGLYSENSLINSGLEVPSDYCISKRLLTKYISSSKFNYYHLHLILPTIYGEREGEHRLIPYTLGKLKNQEAPQFTSGEQIRQYLYVGDIPKLVFKLVEKNMMGIINIPGIQTFSVKGVVEEICEYFKIEYKNEWFGKVLRQDLQMLNLQLAGNLINNMVGDFKYTTLQEVLNKY
jgi:nucleoside-diphosphate-sugar epimerase